MLQVKEIIFLKNLKKLSTNNKIKEVRGLGLILAIEFFSSKLAKKFANLCLNKGLLVLLTEKSKHKNTPTIKCKKIRDRSIYQNI